jgi:predicted transcriptional regulator
VQLETDEAKEQYIAALEKMYGIANGTVEKALASLEEANKANEAAAARIRELEASNFELAKRLLESSERLIALTAERDALCVELDNERRRAEAAEDKFALVPVDGIAMIVRFLDDGAWDESKGEAVESWLNSLGD